MTSSVHTCKSIEKGLKMNYCLKALSEDTIFAQDCSLFDQIRFQSCCVRPTLGNQEESGPIV